MPLRNLGQTINNSLEGALRPRLWPVRLTDPAPEHCLRPLPIYSELADATKCKITIHQSGKEFF